MNSNVAGASPAHYRFAALSELQMPVLKRILLITLVMGWLLMIPNSGHVASARYALNLGLLAWAAIGLWISASHYVAGLVMLLGGLCGYVLAHITIQTHLFYLYLPPIIVLITILLAGRRSAFAVSLLLSVALLSMRDSLSDPTMSQVVAPVLLQMWLIVGLFAQGMSPLYQLIDWSWHSFRFSQQRLDEVREHRQQLATALEQLDHAYHQLENLHIRLEKSKRIAEEERQLKAEFAANISHELRTPVNMVIGFTELMLNAPRNYDPNGLPSALLADLEVVNRNSQHLSQLIDDILDLSQVTANRLLLKKDLNTIREPLEQALEQVRHLFAAKGLSLACSLPDEFPVMMLDTVRLRQVLLNVLSNAARFTERGGVQITIQIEGDALQVAVADTGLGIPSESLGQIFQPFYQVDNSIRRTFGGTGLGLAISRTIIELHDGRMWAESQEGAGTTILFTLPLDERLPYSRLLLSRPLPDTNPAPVERRLVVEQGAAKLVRHLKRHGCWSQIDIADNLPHALALAEASPVDAIVVGAPGPDANLSLPARALTGNGRTPLIACYLSDLTSSYPELTIHDRLVKPVLQAQFDTSLSRLPHVEKILVVDDDPDMVRLITRWLTASPRPYKVWATCGGQEALAVLQARLPDLVVLDLVMPDVDGYAILDYLRARPPLRAIPVMILSAQDPEQEMEETGHLGSLSITTARGLTIEEMSQVIEAVVSHGPAHPASADPARTKAPAG